MKSEYANGNEFICYHHICGPRGQLDGKQERLDGNKAQGLSGEAGCSGHCLARKLAQWGGSME